MPRRQVKTELRKLTDAELMIKFTAATEQADVDTARAVLEVVNERKKASPAGKERRQSPKQRRQVRDESSVGYVIRSIAREYGLPEESVHLVLPWKRKARTDSSLSRFKEHWQAG